MGDWWHGRWLRGMVCSAGLVGVHVEWVRVVVVVHDEVWEGVD